MEDGQSYKYAYAYAQFALCKLVENKKVTKETMADVLRELCYALDLIAESEILEKASESFKSLPEED